MINNTAYRQDTFYFLNPAKDRGTLYLTVLTILGNYKDPAIKSQ